MLNPPVLLGVLAKLFTLLFPEAVRNRLRFDSGPLKDVGDLREISIGGEGRDDFLNQVDALAYDWMLNHSISNELDNCIQLQSKVNYNNPTNFCKFAACRIRSGVAANKNCCCNSKSNHSYYFVPAWQWYPLKIHTRGAMAFWWSGPNYTRV